MKKYIKTEIKSTKAKMPSPIDRRKAICQLKLNYDMRIFIFTQNTICSVSTYYTSKLVIITGARQGLHYLIGLSFVSM